MRKEYHSVHDSRLTQSPEDGTFPPLTRSQIRDLRRRKEDYDDRRRYILASAYSQKFILYYNVSGDIYVLNQPTHATLFKRRATALAVKRQTNKRLQMLACRVNRAGTIIAQSIEKAKAINTKQRKRAG